MMHVLTLVCALPKYGEGHIFQGQTINTLPHTISTVISKSIYLFIYNAVSFIL